MALAAAAWLTATECPAGDYALFFTISNEVSPERPSTIVTLWAQFAPWQYAFAMSNTEVWSQPDPGGLSDPTVLMRQYYYCDPGEVSPDGDSILGIRLLQVHLLGGQFADTFNPIELWSATWTTDDFTPRSVPVWTKTKDFYVYTDDGGGGKDFYGPDFKEADGIIEVVSDGCYPDFTADGVLDLFDFLAFVNAFNAGMLSADCTADGVFDLFDFLCFTNAFNQGC